jgi:hypothetical protein
MAQFAFPLSNSPIQTTENWSKMIGSWSSTGIVRSVLNELQVYADSTGMQVKVRAGAALIKGIYFESDAEVVLPISASDATNPRIDRVIVRLDLATENVELVILQGVPAVSPTAPAVTRNATRWEVPLANVTVSANVVTIAADKIDDTRPHTGVTVPYFTLSKGAVNVASANTLTQIPFDASNIINMSGFTVGASEITFNENGMYFIEMVCDMSGVSSDQTGEVLIRRYLKTDYGDFSSMYRGGTGQGGNSGGVPIGRSAILPCIAGGKLQFFTRFSEAPRTVINTRVNVWKVANL